MSENVGASTSHSPKGLHDLYRVSFTFTYFCKASGGPVTTKKPTDNSSVRLLGARSQLRSQPITKSVFFLFIFILVRFYLYDYDV
jgi:hypothetical protein